MRRLANLHGEFVPDQAFNLNPPARRSDANRGRGRRAAPRALPPEKFPETSAPENKKEISTRVGNSPADLENQSPAPISHAAVESVSEIPREREPQPRRPKNFPRRENFRPAEISAVSQAVQHATEIVGALQQSLNQMEEILELIELAERQKIADEREIEELRRALRRIQPPRQPRDFRREEQNRGPREPNFTREEKENRHERDEPHPDRNPEE